MRLSGVRSFLHLFRRHPVPILIVVLSLSLALCSNAVIFTITDDLLLRADGIRDSTTLVQTYASDKSGHLYQLSYPDALYLQERARSVSGFAAAAFDQVALRHGKENNVVFAGFISSNFFATLGVIPVKGRLFRLGESRIPSSESPIVVSYDCWKSQFHGDDTILGRAFFINEHSFTVIGVTPPLFHGVASGFNPEVWILEANRHDVDADYESRSRTDRSYILVGRLDPSFTRHAAEAELSVLLRQEDMQFPIYKDARNIILTRVSMVPGDMRSAVQNSVRFLHVIAAFVLIIACANISGLFIARSAEREREIAIRVALGAPRAQLLWHVLLECLIVSFLSAVLGIILTFWSSRALLALLPSSLFLSLRLSVNGDVILFVLLLSLVSTLLFGVPIALHYAHVSPGRDLKQAPDTGKTRARTLRTLVIVQISVALILVGAANISFQALDKSIKSYPGFPNRNIVAATFAPGLENTSDHRTRSQLSDVAQQLSALPEIQAVATAEHLPFDPMRSNASISILAPGYSYSSPTSSRSSVAYNIVGPGYFELLGIAILKGRGFTHADEQQTLQVAIVNQVMADRFWKGDAIGQHINLDIPGSTGLQIVGVAQNGRYDSAKGVPQSYLYLPVSQTSFRRMTVLARTRSSPDDAVPAIRELLKVGSGLPLLSVTTLDSALDYVFLVPRACSVIFGFFAGLAFVLSNAGLYALISFTTERRTREIGVRLALGTPRERIATLVLAQALRLSVVGVVAGGIPTLLVIRVLSNMFYGGQGTDLKGLAITVSVVTLTSLIAALVPAVRAAKVDPVEALRYE